MTTDALDFTKWSTRALLAARGRLENDGCEAALEAKAAVADELGARGYGRGPVMSRRNLLSKPFWIRPR